LSLSIGESTNDRTQEDPKSREEIREEDVEKEGLNEEGCEEKVFEKENRKEGRKEEDLEEEGDKKEGLQKEGCEKEDRKEEGGQDDAKEGRYQTKGRPEEILREARPGEAQDQDCVEASSQNKVEGEVESGSGLFGRDRSNAIEIRVQTAAWTEYDVGRRIVVGWGEL
jgi:hypothetical protein